MVRITNIADTHSKHDFITKMNRKTNNAHFPGGDILIHAGDFTMRGYFQELEDFCAWFDKQRHYTHKIFIGGNHDLCLEEGYTEAMEIINQYENITYLQDNFVIVEGLKIWGTPWQPRFYDWAFNLDRNGDELKAKWALIPEDTDILVTHGPAFGILDGNSRGEHMGCELMTERFETLKPKIHVCGHNHNNYGYKEVNGVMHINAANLNPQYIYHNKPITLDYNPENGNIIFL